VPSEDHAASPDHEDQGRGDPEQAHAVPSLGGDGREDECQCAVRRSRAERVPAREGVGGQLDEGILELRASSLEDRLERLAENQAAREGRHHEDRRPGPAAPDEEQAAESRQRAQENSASRVRDDLHHLDEEVRSRPPYPANGADVESVRARPEEHRGCEGHEHGARDGEHGRVQACRVWPKGSGFSQTPSRVPRLLVRHVRTIPVNARLDAVV